MKTKKEMVKYDNYLNELSFKEFSDYDLDFFMVICNRMNELGDEMQTFEYSQLMELLNWDRTKSIAVFHKDLMRMCERLRHVGATVEIDPDNFCAFNLFSTFEGHKKTRTLDVQVNPRFKYILNSLTTKFTTFELSEYIRLDGKYAKLIYQHLKQFRKTGWWQVSVSEIRTELAIPDAYKNMHIMDKVIKPSIEVIKTCKGFADLDVEVLRSPMRGRAIIGYKFKWTADKQIKGQMTIDDYIKTDKPKKKRKAKNSFNNFEQRTYDFDALEEKLLDN